MRGTMCSVAIVYDTTPMRLKLYSVVGLALALSSPQHSASSFVGTWKIDEAKSHLSGTTDSVAAAGPHTWKFQSGTFSWTLTADGSNQPTPFGGETAMKIVSPSTWQFTNTNKGQTAGTETWVLSPDAQSMTRTYSTRSENGEPLTGSAIMKRTSGTSGFEGVWESTEVKMTFDEIVIKPDGDDGLSLSVPADGTHYSLKFDGKEYPEEGLRLPDGMTVSAQITGARTVVATTRLNHKVFDTEEWEISADGSTFTYKQHNAGTTTPAVIILHRVSNP
jgi:hypothetical protein